VAGARARLCTCGVKAIKPSRDGSSTAAASWGGAGSRFALVALVPDPSWTRGASPRAIWPGAWLTSGASAEPVAGSPGILSGELATGGIEIGAERSVPPSPQ
jgi:hypothetical protein